MSKSQAFGLSFFICRMGIIQPVLPSLTTLQGCCKVHMGLKIEMGEWYKVVHVKGTSGMPFSILEKRKSLQLFYMEVPLLYPSPHSSFPA